MFRFLTSLTIAGSMHSSGTTAFRHSNGDSLSSFSHNNNNNHGKEDIAVASDDDSNTGEDKKFLKVRQYAGIF